MRNASKLPPAVEALVARYVRTVSLADSRQGHLDYIIKRHQARSQAGEEFDGRRRPWDEDCFPRVTAVLREDITESRRAAEEVRNTIREACQETGIAFSVVEETIQARLEEERWITRFRLDWPTRSTEHGPDRR